MSYRCKKLLKIMKNAQNYNNIIVDMTLESIGNKNKKILDFGTGYDYFTELLKEKNVSNITCVEIDEELNNHCKSLNFLLALLYKISSKTNGEISSAIRWTIFRKELNYRSTIE